MHRRVTDGGRWATGLCLVVGLAACGPALPDPDSLLPPSASDLALLGATHLCDAKDDVVRRRQDARAHTIPWGAGEQLQDATPLASSDGAPIDRFYFFNADDTLVGAVFRFTPGLDLAPYPVLRQTLSALTPASTFFLDPTQLLSTSEARIQSAALYRTGDMTSTTQYLVLEHDDTPVLLVASMALDPYEQLLSGYHKKFLPGLKRTRAATSAADGATPVDDFPGLQQFARGEAALFGSCGHTQPTIAVDAYRRAIQYGINDEARFAGAHHRLGLALRDQGELADAQLVLEQALALQPHAPEIINSLGRVLAEQRQWTLAMPLFERALVLRPNFIDARFNLGESLERNHPRRAIEEYETYLALAEGLLREAQRIQTVQDRVRRLKGE